MMKFNSRTMSLKAFGRSLAVAATVAVVLSACSSPRRAPAFWSFQVKNATKGCLFNVDYDWGVGSAARAGPYLTPRFCSSESGTTLYGTLIPEKPFEITWTNNEGHQILRAIDFSTVLKGHELYGGSLTVVLTKSTVQVWLAEPDKRIYSELGVYPKKKNLMIFESS